jgi:hypothetical protein
VLGDFAEGVAVCFEERAGDEAFARDLAELRGVCELEEVEGRYAVDCDVQGVEQGAGAFDVELVGRVLGAVVVEDLVEGFARGI